MIHLLFKGTNPVTSIGVSNLKYEIEKSTLAKFGKMLNKFLIKCIPSTISLIIREKVMMVMFNIYSDKYFPEPE